VSELEAFTWSSNYLADVVVVEVADTRFTNIWNGRIGNCNLKRQENQSWNRPI